jgi:threonine dehydrogenase-like Zn-dependent dehydrogenase
MKRSKASVPFGQMESGRLWLFDGTIDELGASVAGRMEGERAGVGWHGGHCGYCDSCRRGSQQASLANTPPA